MGFLKLDRLLVLVAATTVFAVASNANAAIKEPTALVAATFTLTAQQPYVQGACPYAELYDALYTYLVGTETDASNPPHPELTGNLTATVVTYLKVGGKPSAGTIKATLTDDAGQVLYQGRGSFAATIDTRAHVVGSGLLTATLYRNGSPTDHLLIASFTLDQELNTYGITGQFGATSGQASYAIETAGACSA
jgi:hypothetical protein